ncbi:hypothetical protein OOK31_01280 [Streptomyces sp. NBC_00249]|uniref:hypothetical protein n=1 Tax=Streptomyces sp. NBC_00249 TaxID=2975690 RepID=UPI00225710A2|nr:hypothetical protein [Streptomyces sp. NBC_00249]MCX5192532.1 hypothetical protein [Streptomyces sp. NBC_00249]
MYTLLFLLIFLCVMAVLQDRPARIRLPLWTATLALSVLAFLPHVLDHTFHIAL